MDLVPRTYGGLSLNRVTATTHVAAGSLLMLAQSARISSRCDPAYNLGRPDLVELTRKTIEIDRLLASVTHPECGAQVLFVGTTRQWTGEVETHFLEYDGYEEMALKMLEKLEAEARARWSLQAVALAHRLGRVDIAQASVAVAVGAAHRAEAFEAARWLIDQLKEHVPIWKCEHGQSPAKWVHPS